MSDNNEWTEAVIARLRKLWAEGVSTRKIGLEMGLSKNAVVGKAHRLALPPRPNPIKGRDPNAPAPTHGKLRARVSAQNAAAVLAVFEDAGPSAGTAPRAPEYDAAQPRKQPLAIAPAAVGRTLPCCWPLGDPGTPGFCYCDAPSVPSRPYCPDHVKRAYVRVDDGRLSPRRVGA